MEENELRQETVSNILVFINKIINEKEKEDFRMKTVNLGSSWDFLPDNFTVGQMIIIGNDAFWDASLGFADDIVTDFQCNQILNRSRKNGGKALFLRFKQSPISGNKKFYIKKSFLDSNSYMHSEDFPYLAPSLNLLNKSSNDDIITMDHVKGTLNYYKHQEEFGVIDSKVEVPKKRIENIIIKSLNRIK